MVKNFPRFGAPPPSQLTIKLAKTYLDITCHAIYKHFTLSGCKQSKF
jgi:hypothetical protein